MIELMVKNKPRKKHMILVIISLTITLIVLAIALLATINSNNARQKLADYPVETANLPSGKVTYADSGSGSPVVLVAHGINGGYDQGYDSLKRKSDSYRVIAPSRFGYLRSDIPADASPGQQAKVYAELLDTLGIDKVYILGTSAGGTVAIRFALDYPERTKGLILYCSAAPLTEKTSKVPEYLGPPEAILNDFTFTLISPLFPIIMGLPPSVATGSMPLAERKAGIVNDAKVTNPDMLKNFDNYPIENIEAPVLIFHAKDDKVAPYEAMEKGATRFKNKQFVTFQSGGHMMEGNDQTISETLDNFVNQNE